MSKFLVGQEVLVSGRPDLWKVLEVAPTDVPADYLVLRVDSARGAEPLAVVEGDLQLPNEPIPVPPSRYHRRVKAGWIDVYDVLDLYAVTSQPVGHAIKKLLMPGQRGGKSLAQDLREAKQSIERAIEMAERSAANGP